MHKIPFTVSKLVLIIAFLNVFSWSVYHANKGGKRLGFLTEFIVEFSKFPDLIAEVYRREKIIPVDPNFNQFNNLNYDIFALNANFQRGKWITRLTNLRTDSVIFEWILEKKDFYFTDRRFSHADPRVPILLSDTSLILHNDESFNLFRLNSNSEIVWKNNDFHFHHAINLDHAGNIWACTRNIVAFPKNNMEYWDNCITQVAAETGRTLFHKSLTQILLENDLSYILHGYNNAVHRAGDDPLHLNEIEPVLKDGPFWKVGDLFLSLRHRSMILLYRPSTNKIIHIIQGDFYNQHDIDIISDTIVSIFNNNVSPLQRMSNSPNNEVSVFELLPNERLNLTSEVLMYDMSNSSFSSLYPNQFVSNKIFTATQGVHSVLSNGDLFVEEWAEGKIFIFNKEEVLLKKYFNKPGKGLIEYTHWIRIYENLDFIK